MSKIKIKTKEKTRQNIIFEGYGIKTDDKLIYYDKQDKTEVIMYDTKIELTRTTNDGILYLNLDPIKPDATYKIKDQGIINLPISNVKIKQKETELTLQYQIDNEKFEIEIEYQVIE